MNETLTASELSRLLGMKRPTVHLRLQGIAPAGMKRVSGNTAKAWAIADLPHDFKSHLEKVRKLEGCRDILQVEGEEPAPALNVSAATLGKAEKLREALRRPIQIQHTVSKSDLLETGLMEFRRAFGFEISARQWDRLFLRTIYRDGGKNQFERVSLYLDERKIKVRPGESVPRFDFPQLHDQISYFADPAKPTRQDCQFLLDAAFRWFEGIENGSSAKETRRAKGAVLEFLFHNAPGISASLDALRKRFEYHYKKWTEQRTMEALEDGRKGNGNGRPEFQEDIERIAAEAVKHRGNVSIAFRTLWRENRLSHELMARYDYDVRRNKSYVPRSIRQEADRIAKRCRQVHLGQHATKMSGPTIDRDWKDVKAGDWFFADDVTLNNYFYFYDAEGKLHIERGECLLMIDARSMYPIDFVLISGKYNGQDIRKLITHIHDGPGLPRCGFYFENGIWSSRLIDGRSLPGEIEWRQTEAGLAASGVKVIHALPQNPKAKVIECMIGILQRMQEGQPGWVGPDEKKEKYERMQEFISLARRGKVDPAAQLLSMEEWVKLISATLDKFKEEPQNGKLLDDSTPAEMWEREVAKAPLRKLPNNARHLLATHQREVTVRSDGITLKIGSQKFNYFEPAIAPLEGHRIRAYFNFEFPDLLTISDLKGKKFYSVRRGPVLPALIATPDQLREAQRRIAEYNKARRALYGSINHHIISTISRDAAHDEQTREFGRYHNETVAAAKEERKSKHNERSRMDREIADLMRELEEEAKP